jgi:hypothetical protein
LNPVRREYGAETGTPARLAFTLQCGLMPFQHMFDNRQAETRAAEVA